jgi:hypothetical protein
VTPEKHEDTQESDALGAEVRFDREDAEAIGDPAAASVEAEGAVPGSAGVEAPGASETASDALTEPLSGDPAGIAGEPGAEWQPPGPAEQTPAAADRRGAEQAESPPFIPIAGAFVGAFVAAKLLGKLGGGDD